MMNSKKDITIKRKKNIAKLSRDGNITLENTKKNRYQRTIPKEIENIDKVRTRKNGFNNISTRTVKKNSRLINKKIRST